MKFVFIFVLAAMHAAVCGFFLNNSFFIETTRLVSKVRSVAHFSRQAFFIFVLSLAKTACNINNGVRKYSPIPKYAYILHALSYISGHVQRLKKCAISIARLKNRFRNTFTCSIVRKGHYKIHTIRI